MREIDLLAPLAKYYMDKGYRAFAEVKFSSRWIDVYLVNEETNESIAIELKLANWKKAYKQAKVYPLVADFVFVGMPKEFIHRALDKKDWFHETGIGLLSIGEEIEVVLPTKKSNILLSKVKKEIVKNLDPDMEVVLDEQDKLAKTFYPCGRIK